MPTPATLAGLAGLLADPTRAAFCLALLDGRAWTAGELARHADVAASTASEHLTRLVEGGLLTEERQGRHRYVRLAGTRAARLIEDLAAAAPPGPPPRTLRASTASAALARGRTCYDHLAGRLGVAVTDAAAAGGLLERDAGFAVTAAGRDWLGSALAVGPEELRGSRRPVVRGCLDWTERVPHLAGLAGARVCAVAFERGWVQRVGSGRAVRLTDEGPDGFRTELGLHLVL